MPKRSPRRQAPAEHYREVSLARFRNGPPPSGPLLSLRGPEAEVEALRAWAKRRRVAPTEALRRAILRFLAAEDEAECEK